MSNYINKIKGFVIYDKSSGTFAKGPTSYITWGEIPTIWPSLPKIEKFLTNVVHMSKRRARWQTSQDPYYSRVFFNKDPVVINLVTNTEEFSVKDFISEKIELMKLTSQLNK